MEWFDIYRHGMHDVAYILQQHGPDRARTGVPRRVDGRAARTQTSSL